MTSWNRSFSSSPVVVLPPSHPPQMDRPSFTSPFVASNGTFQPTLSNLTPTSAPSSAAGRKRSRDEAAPNLEEDYFAVQAPAIEEEPENEDEWEYGEGMTLIKPNAKYITQAESQTGTWAEEKAEQEKVRAAMQVLDRPIIRATKSQRLDTTVTPLIEDMGVNGAMNAPSPERNAYVEPTIDQFTRHLGIGWSSISDDPDIQAAARGWTRFIENHFPITDARIQLQSRGLASYLVQANEGFFLFAEDLKKGQLVSTSLERVWVNLSSPVPVFDGDLVLEAIETPQIITEVPGMDQPSLATNGGVEGVTDGAALASKDHTVSTHSMEVDMDMS